MAQRFNHLSKRLKEIRQTFSQMCRNDVPGLLAARTYAQQFVDQLQRTISEETVAPEGWCVVAVGGFGRGELSFASDLDLLFLHQNRLPQPIQELFRELIYSLWDGAFEVGHATASISAAKRLANEDFTVLTNHLEAKFIAGDRELFTNWRKTFLDGFGSKSRRRFLQNLVRYREERLHRYGESSYLLEPHIKEGVGGLRDLQVIQWAAVVFDQDPSFETLIARKLLSLQEKLWLEQAHDFLWRVRLQLHQMTGRRQDQLLFPEQEQIAKRMGCMDSLHWTAVESFMRLYYRQTARIRRTASFFLERLEELQRKSADAGNRRRILPGPVLLEGKHLHFMEPEWIKKDPRLLMRFFWQAAQSDAHFHHQAGQAIRENLDLIDDSMRRDPEVVKQFFDILTDPIHSFPVLKAMLEIRFLDVFIPEFAPVRYRVQHDVYHLYTVDEHLLRTVRELHLMEQGKDEALASLRLGEVFGQLAHRRILFLAALLHDIGKGEGRNHATRGAIMAKGIAERIGLSPEESDLLCFLIEHHLILAETALKRDLMDEKPISQCALEIIHPERLNMLYLLTIADSRATGPGAWNTWKASLLRELFAKVGRLLLRGDWKGEDIRSRSMEAQERILALVDDSPDRERVAHWLEKVSFRYLFSQRPESVLHHFQMEAKLAEAPLVLRTERVEGEMCQVTIATRDRPGLFAMITGVLWGRGLNILAADIFTRETGVALDILIIERLPDPLHADELWAKVENDLSRCLVDGGYMEKLLENKRKPSLLQSRTTPRKPDLVLIDEDASDFYTIIEVYTWDRPGVLHAITSTLFNLRISIQLAKISTPGAQVADVFYVTDLSGNKLMNYELHEKIRTSILDCL
jgi:[protein-PII] uridylyltransferase